MERAEKRVDKRFQNCFICFFRPALHFGRTGITVLNFHCDHSQNGVKCSLERSWPATVITTILALVIFLVGLHNAYALYGTKMRTREDVLHLEAIMLNFIAAYLLSVGVRRTEIKISDLKGIIELLKYGEEMGIIFLDKSFVKMGQRVTLSIITMFITLQSCTVLIFISRGDFSFTAFKGLCTDTCVFMQGTLATHYITLHLLKLHMFKKVLHKMEQIVDDRLNNARLSEQAFSTAISHLCRLYSCTYLNLLEDDKFVGPAFLIWWNTILAGNILTAYVLITSAMMQLPLDVANIIFILKVYGCLIGVTIYLVVLEITAAVVSALNVFVFPHKSEEFVVYVRDIKLVSHGRKVQLD